MSVVERTGTGRLARRAPYLLVSVALLAYGAVSLPARAQNPAMVLPQGVWLGASVGTRGSETTLEAVGNLEAKLGRRLEAHRTYSRWDDAQPSAIVAGDQFTGRAVALSIKASRRDGSVVPWGDIASGAQDAAIEAQANGLKGLGQNIWLTFHHEPENDPAHGTAAQYVAAFQHYVQKFRDLGVTNVSFVVNLMAVTFNNGTADRWYPGDDYVDWIGADGYNWFNCHGVGWLSFNDVFSNFHTFGVAHGKPLMLPEWGTPEDPGMPGRKAQWITDASTTIKSWPEVKAVSYWSSAVSNCQFYVDSSDSSLAAYAAMAADPYFSSVPQVVLSATPASGPGPLSVSFNGASTTDGDSPISSWTLDFGDGSPPTSGSGAPPASVPHAYSGTATYGATLKVTDTTGITSQTSATVQVQDGGPPPSGTPAVTTGAATGVQASSAGVQGTVNPNGAATTWHFEYGTTTAYGQQTADQVTGADTTPLPVSAALTGLTPGATYHYRLDGTNANGSGTGADATFTTLPDPPTVTTGAATGVQTNSAGVQGTVNPNGAATTWHFEYGTTIAYGQQTPDQVTGTDTTPLPVSATLAGLSPGATYHYRLDGTNAGGSVTGTDATFTTLNPPPVVTVLAATSVAKNTAVLNGTVNPQALSTSYHFEYGTTTAYGTSTPFGDAGAGVTPVAVSAATSTSLVSGTTYHYRLVATNAGGTTASGDMTFTTLSAPAVTTSAATGLTRTGATLTGQVDPRGLTTTYYFQYGRTTFYSTKSTSKPLSASFGSVAVSSAITGLLPRTTYHYRVVATNSLGTTFGADMSFTTPA